jgi:hypothetical protein
MPAQVPSARRWHCREHLSQAQPGDMDPPPLPLDLHMRLLDPDEIEREDREDERLRQEQELRRRERAAEAEAIRKAEERYYEAHKDDPYVNPWAGSDWRARTARKEAP